MNSLSGPVLSLGSVGSPQYTRGSRKHLANGRHRESVASTQMAGRTHRWHEANKYIYHLISHLFPCPAGQVLFQNCLCVPFLKVRVAIPWLSGIRGYPVAGFMAARTLTAKKTRQERKKYMIPAQHVRVKEQNDKNAEKRRKHAVS